MVVGTTLFKLDGNPYYSSEFGRGGLAATFSIDVTQVSGAPGVVVSIETRNSEQTTWTNLASFGAIVGSGVATLDATGLMEIVRFRYDFDVGAASSDAIHFLMQAPSWRPY